jgi:type VI secretion system protein ImpF
MTKHYNSASLLDRLIDLKPREKTEKNVFRAYSKIELQEAVLRDLTWLLNTRCPISYKVLEKREQRSVIDYGIPDFGDLYTQNPDDRAILIEAIEQAIHIYEPRLKDVKVILDKEQDQRQLTGYIEANLIFNQIVEPLTFPMTIQTQKQWMVSFNEKR